MVFVEDGTGNGYSAKVSSSNRVYTFAVTEPEAITALKLGNSYNLNTGLITVSGSTANATMYFKNNESSDFVIEAIAVGMGSGTIGAGTTGMIAVDVLRNPTAGTIISEAVDVASKQNRNFGSSKTLTADVYKGDGAGKTFTDGTEVAKFFTGLSGRLFATVNFQVPKGDAAGITITPNVTGTDTVTCYVAIVGHLFDAAQI